MIQLIPDPHREELLGGVLRFISYRDTLQLLRSWATEHRHLRQLAELSEQLADFPDLTLPSTSQPIHLQFGGQMEVNYLAVQLSTRRAPGLSAREQFQITCLRTWMLFKALQFADAGHRADRSLKHLCSQVRMGLDDRDGGQKLAWFLGVTPPALTLQRFELELQLNIKQPSRVSSTADETIRSIQGLLDSRVRPDPVQLFTWPAEFLDNHGAFIQPQRTAISEVEDQHEVDTLYLPSSETEDELLLSETTVAEEATPPQATRESRGIALQSQEDQQYLPFSWNRLRPDELAEFKTAIQTRLVDPDPGVRLLAAITVVAWITRRSMETVESLSLSTATTDVWQLDPYKGRLHRQPARRSVRWRADVSAQGWVRPLAETWEVQLHPTVQAPLLSAYQTNSLASSIGQLWADPKVRLESAFNHWCVENVRLRRVSSGQLVRLSEQAVFQESLDSTFARLVSSPSRAGIPGAGAYPSWSNGQVVHAMNQIADAFATMEVVDPDCNGLGSELDPDDALLADAMARAREKLDTFAIRPDQWMEYHNHLVAYGVSLLLAATGARPVTSVFESSHHFDLHLGYVYLEDKISRTALDGTAGRLVPLVSTAADFLATVYFPYLRHLATELRPQLLDLADEIELQANGTGSQRLPLFFLFKQKPEFDWLEVSESSLNSLGLLSWPLPLNLFRHRLASRLRTLGLDPELIDAQLGHAETGSETFGDFSPRCWETDEPAWQNALQKCFDLLNIQLPALSRHPITGIRLAPGYHPFPDESLFGREARAQERIRRKKVAAERALEEIHSYVGNRPINSISPEEWQQLGRQMLLTDNNLRQPNAAVRYQVYERYLQREWREHGRRPRLKKWLSQMPAPQSTFAADVIGVSARLDAVRSALDSAHQQTPFPPSKALAALLSALDLCVFGRVTSPGVLQALAQADRSKIRLVLFEQQAYIEYSEVLDKNPSTPVLRYLLTSRCARLADHALTAGKALALTEWPDTLENVVKTIGCSRKLLQSVDHVLSQLAQSISQENARCLPGVIAAVLAGRLTSYALPWEDWIRVRNGQAHSRSDTVSANNEAEQLDEVDWVGVSRAPIGLVDSANRENSKVACRQFLGRIRAVLTRYLAGRSEEHESPPSATSPELRTNTDNSSRRDARTAIKAILEKPEPAVSIAVHALGAWTLHLLNRPYRKGLLDAASIKRYLDTLAPGFLSFGYELDIADLDGDEVTEFYRSVIEQDNSDERVSDNKGDAIQESGHTRHNQKYVLQRLIEFHRFGQERYGLEAPDWSEIDDGLLCAMAHPGTITQDEYLHALHTLCAEPFTSEATRVRDAFVLLLAYRFGLRGGEVIGLRRHDWVEVASATVVLVSARYRQLKSRSSQRQVPLLEPLTTHEKQVVQRWLAHWAVEIGNHDQRMPLFFDEGQHAKVTDIRQIRARLITALRSCTCSSHVTLHHARHAFANRMALHLVVRDPVVPWPAHAPHDLQQSQSIQRATVSTSRQTRRTPWAVARLLGHASPRTTFNSYLHVQFDWTAQRVREMSPGHFAAGPRRKFKIAIDLDLWPVVENYLIGIHVPPVPESRPCTPALVLKYFRLRAQGMPPHSAGEHCLLARAEWQRIEDSLILAGRKLAPSSSAPHIDVAAIAFPQVLLGRVQGPRWSALIGYIEQREQEAPVLPSTSCTDAIGQQIGRTRQLLLWSEDHFVQLRQFMEWMRWTGEHLALFRPAKLDPLVTQWAQVNGFTHLRSTQSAAGRKVLQIDVASDFLPGLPAITHPDRVAAVIGAANPIARDGYEFLLMWLGFQLSQQAKSVQSTPGAQE